jgi:hypothetical protein
MVNPIPVCNCPRTQNFLILLSVLAVKQLTSACGEYIAYPWHGHHIQNDTPPQHAKFSYSLMYMFVWLGCVRLQDAAAAAHPSQHPMLIKASYWQRADLKI